MKSTLDHASDTLIDRTALSPQNTDAFFSFGLPAGLLLPQLLSLPDPSQAGRLLQNSGRRV